MSAPSLVPRGWEEERPWERGWEVHEENEPRKAFGRQRTTAENPTYVKMHYATGPGPFIILSSKP